MPAAHRCADRPFSDPARVPGLYADQGRVARRSGALLSAKTQGRHVGMAIADIAATSTTTPDHNVIADIGCGWGGTTGVLCERFPPARLLAVDASAAMLHHARARLCAHAAAGPPTRELARYAATHQHLDEVAHLRHRINTLLVRPDSP